MVSVKSAARHFDAAADDYERSRPGYPAKAIRFLASTVGLRPGVRVLDLGAGTGKLSRSLLSTGVDLTAVEPLPRMRAVYEREVPKVPVLDGVAEAIPLPDASADVVVAGQAFHWFATREALDEIARVLAPGGYLALLWNKRDQSVPWVKRFSSLLEPYRGNAPTYRGDRWRKAFDGSPFTKLRHRRFSFALRQDRATVVARAMSVSFIAGLPSDERARVAEAVGRMLDEDPETAGRPSIRFPYETTVYWARKRGGARSRDRSSDRSVAARPPGTASAPGRARRRGAVVRSFDR